MVRNSDKTSFWNKPMPEKTAFLLLIACFVLYMFNGFLGRGDIDAYYIVATGREIVHNGFPHEHIWNIGDTSGLIVQQWLYCVIFYGLDQLPFVSYAVFNSVILGVLFWVSYKFLRVRGLLGVRAVICVMLSVLINYLYIAALRPELITITLLMLECLSLEEFRATNNKKHLVLLPVTMLFEINLHGSMWPIHFAILLAYMCPAFYCRKKASDVSLFRQWKSLLPFIIAMGLVMFVNPYGIDMLLYPFKAYMSGALSACSLAETLTPGLFSIPGAFFAVVAVMVIFLFRFGSIDSSVLNMTVGFGLFSLLAYRNIMFDYFLFIGVLPLFLDTEFVKNKIDIKKDLTNACYFLFIPVLLILFLVNGFSLARAMNKGVGSRIKYDYPSMQNIIDYLDANTNKDTHIFTTCSAGSYLEYAGYTNIYLDTRPEFASDIFTGDEDYPFDFYYYTVTRTRHKSDDRGVLADQWSIEAFNAWVKDCGFEYFIIDEEMVVLTKQFADNSDYVEIPFDYDDGEEPYYRLFCVSDPK